MTGKQRHRATAACIDGLDGYHVVEPMFEAVRIVLAQRGAPFSTDYIQGVSGAAFRVAGICPCAPTCSAAMSPADLVRLLGYEAETVTLESAGVDWTKLQELAGQYRDGMLPDANELTDADHRTLRTALDGLIEAAKSEIEAGRPVVAWHAFTFAENDVIAGFDDATGEFLGRGSYEGAHGEYARAPQLRMVTAGLAGGWPSVLAIRGRSSTFAAADAEVAALREAVRHARTTPDLDEVVGDEWAFLEGLAAYERWIDDFSSPTTPRTAGDAYCYGVYRSSHRAAAGFLREIASRHASVEGSLLAAAVEFEAEADTLDRAEKLLWWQSPEDPDAERNQEAAGFLASARDSYARGIAAIEEAVGRIDGS